jgi:uncharacterized glyoxalase superfamily protein PhnB
MNDHSSLRLPGAVPEILVADLKAATAVAERLKENGVEFVKDVHDTDWQTREIVLHDDQGHTLILVSPYFPSPD